MFKGKRKFQIYTYLEIYGKLSLTEISEKLNKSKSTIYEHLKFLNKIGLVNINKRPVPTSPPTKGQKVKENIYSINQDFELSFENLIPGLNLKKAIKDDQMKKLAELMLYITKMQMSNLNIQKQVFEKILEMIDKNPNQIRKKFKILLGQNTMDNQKDYLYTFTEYLHLSLPEFKFILDKAIAFNNLEKNEEFKALSGEEKPIILTATAMPMKAYIEFLNEKE